LSELQIQDLSPGPHGLVAMHYHFVEFPILSQEEIYYGEKGDFFFFFFSFLENKTLMVGYFRGKEEKRVKKEALQAKDKKEPLRIDLFQLAQVSKLRINGETSGFYIIMCT